VQRQDVSPTLPVLSPESDSDAVYATLPPGPYVPAWLQDGEEKRPQDDDELQSSGHEPHKSAGSLADLDVREYLLSQKEDAAAEFQLRAQVLPGDRSRHARRASSLYFQSLWTPNRGQPFLTCVKWFCVQARHELEFNTTVASVASADDADHRSTMDVNWHDRSIKGSGTEYGTTSMQSKSMRRLGMHRKDQF